jgi:hypothetical protein
MDKLHFSSCSYCQTVFVSDTSQKAYRERKQHEKTCKKTEKTIGKVTDGLREAIRITKELQPKDA